MDEPNSCGISAAQTMEIVNFINESKFNRDGSIKEERSKQITRDPSKF